MQISPGNGLFSGRYSGTDAMRSLAVADSRWRSFPLRGSLPFSGANAALGYLPLQLALRFEGRKLKDPSGERPILRTM